MQPASQTIQQQIGTLSATTNHYGDFKNRLSQLQSSATSLDTRVTALEGGEGPDETRLSALEVKCAPITNTALSTTFKVTKPVEIHGAQSQLTFSSYVQPAGENPGYSYTRSIYQDIDDGALIVQCGVANGKVKLQAGSAPCSIEFENGITTKMLLSAPLSDSVPATLNKELQVKDYVDIKGTNNAGQIKFNDTTFEINKGVRVNDFIKVYNGITGNAQLSTNALNQLITGAGNSVIINGLYNKVLELNDDQGHGSTLVFNQVNGHLVSDVAIDMPGGGAITSGAYSAVLTATAAGLDINNNIVSTGSLTLVNGTKQSTLSASSTSNGLFETAANLSMYGTNANLKLGLVEMFDNGTQLEIKKGVYINRASTAPHLILHNDGLVDVELSMGQNEQLVLNSSLELPVAKSLFWGTTEVKKSSGALQFNCPLKIYNGTQSCTLETDASNRIYSINDLYLNGAAPTLNLGLCSIVSDSSSLLFNKPMRINGTALSSLVLANGAAGQFINMFVDANARLNFDQTIMVALAKAVQLGASITLQADSDVASTGRLKTNAQAFVVGGYDGSGITLLNSAQTESKITTNATAQLECSQDLFVNSSNKKIFLGAASIQGGSSLLTLSKNTKITGDASECLTLNNGSQECTLNCNSSTQLAVNKPVVISGTTSDCLNMKSGSNTVKAFCDANGYLSVDKSTTLAAGKSFFVSTVAGVFGAGSTTSDSNLKWSNTSPGSATLYSNAKNFSVGVAGLGINAPTIVMQSDSTSATLTFDANSDVSSNQSLKVGASKHFICTDSTSKVCWGSSTGVQQYVDGIDSTVSTLNFKTNILRIYSNVNPPQIKWYNGLNTCAAVYQATQVLEFDKPVKATDLATANFTSVETAIKDAHPIGQILTLCVVGGVPTIPGRTIAACNGATYDTGVWATLYARRGINTLPNIADLEAGISKYYIVVL